MSQLAVAALAEVAERIKTSHQEVSKRVVDALVEKEVAKRVVTLDTALAKYTELKRGLDKLRPDVENFAADGTKSESYSKAKWDEKKKGEEKLEKLSSALEGALSEGNFAKLNEVLQKLGGDKGGEKSE